MGNCLEILSCSPKLKDIVDKVGKVEPKAVYKLKAMNVINATRLHTRST